MFRRTALSLKTVSVPFKRSVAAENPLHLSCRRFGFVDKLTSTAGIVRKKRKIKKRPTDLSEVHSKTRKILNIPAEGLGSVGLASDAYSTQSVADSTGVQFDSSKQQSSAHNSATATQPTHQSETSNSQPQFENASTTAGNEPEIGGVETHEIDSEQMQEILSDKPYIWLQFEDKHIFVLGVFHREQQSIIMTQNVILSSQPDNVVVELCPWRGKRLEELLANFPYFQTPRDAEAAAILSAAQLGISPMYCDLPEHVLFNLLSKVDPAVAKEVFDVGFHEPIFKDKRIEAGIMASELRNGKTPSNWDEIDEECAKLGVELREFEDSFVYTRAGLRELIRKYSGIEEKIREVLYTEREKHFIKSLVRAEGDKIVCVVGMAHLDGIERLWRDMDFWADERFWTLGMDMPWYQQKYYQYLYNLYTNILNRPG